MSVILLHDDIVHYEVLGRGKPLIFLHGWIGSWRYWVPAMQAVSVSYRAYALDLWGFGDTAKRPEGYALDQQVALLEEFVDNMGIPKVAIIGHGLGAVVGLLFAHTHPQAVDRVMAVALPNGARPVHPRLKAASPLELAEWLLGRDAEGEAVRQEVPKTDPRAISISLETMQTVNLEELPWELSTPCLLVYGQNDPLIEATGESALPLPENFHQIFFEGSRHFPMLDESSKFNRLVADFLALSSGVSPRQLQLKEEWKRRVR